MPKTTPQSVNRNIEAETSMIRNHRRLMQNELPTLTSLVDAIERDGYVEAVIPLIEAYKAWCDFREELEPKLLAQFKRTKRSLLRIRDDPEYDLASAKHNALLQVYVDRRREGLELMLVQELRRKHLNALSAASAEIESNSGINYTDSWWEESRT